MAMERILFVDDEQRVLDGLRNVLRSRRREWDMRFARGGEAAFALLASETFDVVVSDMRMPRYDGTAVLARARDLQPHAVRIVLSAQTEADTAMKAVFVAHLVMSKPCDPMALQDTLQRACHLRALFDGADIQQAIGRMAILPTTPATSSG
jgi:DNA-binding NtrC family response regulator